MAENEPITRGSIAKTAITLGISTRDVFKAFQNPYKVFNIPDKYKKIISDSHIIYMYDVMVDDDLIKQNMAISTLETEGKALLSESTTDYYAYTDRMIEDCDNGKYKSSHLAFKKMVDFDASIHIQKIQDFIDKVYTSGYQSSLENGLIDRIDYCHSQWVGVYYYITKKCKK